MKKFITSLIVLVTLSASAQCNQHVFSSVGATKWTNFEYIDCDGNIHNFGLPAGGYTIIFCADIGTAFALNGDLIILDHKDIDIVVQPKNNKVVTFAKEILSDAVYGAESRLLEFLRKHGIIEYDSIQGGNIYGSLEGKIMESDGTKDSINATLLNIHEWMKTEQSYIQGTTAYEEMQDDALIEPENKDSTDLGEVPQSAEKGSISTKTIFAPYMYGRFAI